MIGPMMNAESAEKTEKCIVEGCGKKRRALGFCMGHYHRFRAGRSFATPLQKHKAVSDVSVCARISLTAKAVLLALAEEEEQSFYRYTSEILEEHAERLRGTVRFEKHLRDLERAATKKDKDLERAG